MQNTLKNTLLAVMISASMGIEAQETTNHVTNFSNSYKLEYNRDYVKAAAEIKKIYDEDNYEQNLRLGWLDYLAGFYKESAEYYKRAMTILPLSIEARLGYAAPLYAMGNTDAVIDVYKEILKIDSENYYGNYRIGVVYYELARYAEGQKHFEKLLNHYPFEYDVIIMSAWNFYRLGKLREAKVLFNKALLNRPGDSSALEGLGLIK